MNKLFYLRQAEEWYECTLKEVRKEMADAGTQDDIEGAKYNLEYHKSVLEAIRKQIAMEPVKPDTHVGKCPRCGRQIILLPYDRYCARCGQRIRGKKK